MDWTLASKPKRQTTRPAWIVRVVFNNLTDAERLFKFRDGNLIGLPFTLGVF